MNISTKNCLFSCIFSYLYLYLYIIMNKEKTSSSEGWVHILAVIL